MTPDWITRAQAEARELRERVDKLQAFIKANEGKKLIDVKTRDLLIDQEAYMLSYLSVLQQRIEHGLTIHHRKWCIERVRVMQHDFLNAPWSANSGGNDYTKGYTVALSDVLQALNEGVQ